MYLTLTLVLIAEAIDASGVAPSLTEVWGGSSALGGARTVWLRACCERSMEQSMPEGLFVLVETLLRYALNTCCALLYGMLVFPFSPTPTRPSRRGGRGPAAYKQKNTYFPRYYVTCRGSLQREKKHEKLARTHANRRAPRAAPLVQTRTGQARTSRGAAGGAARARP